jgi:tetratricopeptide (TPR) repeat protein
MSRRSKQTSGGKESAAAPTRATVSQAGETLGMNSTQEAAHPQPGARRKDWWLGLLLVAATILAYQPVWHAGFIWDDNDYVTFNQTLHDLHGLRQIWFDPQATQQYYPLVFTSFWLEYHAWKLNPLGYHVVNVLLHALGSILLWRVLKRLQLPGAWLAAAIFALHPVNVESVAWIAERKNVLSGVFFFAAGWAYLLFVGECEGKRPGRGWWVAALLLFVCALWSKTAACSLPVVLLLARWWEKGRLGRRDVLPMVPFFIVGLWLGLQTARLETHHAGASGPEFSISFAERCLIAGRALWFYAGKLVWPAPLYIYRRWQIDVRIWWQWLFPAAALALAAALWFGRKRMGRGPPAAVLIFAITLFPALGFLDMNYMRFSFVADHFQYLAEVGIIVLAAGGMTLALRRWETDKPWLGRALCLCLLLTLGAMTRQQCKMYADQETLWRANLALNPDSLLAHDILGEALVKNGKLDDAIAHFKKALELNSNYAEALNDLGYALYLKKEPDEAITQYKKALEIRPDFAEAWNHLGTALRQEGKLDEAIAQYHRALELNPAFAEAQNNLGNALSAEGRLDEAIAQFRMALEFKPDNAEIHYNLGVALFADGDLGQSIAQYREALRINPGYAEALNNLGNALLLKGDVDGAMACLKKSSVIDPDLVESWYNLGNVFQRKGDSDQAIVCYRRAINVNPRYVDSYANLGVALFHKGDTKEALDSWQKALEINPDQLFVLNNLAWTLATTPDASLRNGTKAVVLAAKANQLSGGGDPTVLRTLAAAYAEEGSYGLALVTARRALALVEEQKNDGLRAELEQDIKLYEADTPVREAAR